MKEFYELGIVVTFAGIFHIIGGRLIPVSLRSLTILIIPRSKSHRTEQLIKFSQELVNFVLSELTRRDLVYEGEEVTLLIGVSTT